APLAIGAILMAMVYAGGHISGAHYNPAVTLAVLIRRRIEIRDAIGYWIAQLCGGLVASVLVSAVAPEQMSPMTVTRHAAHGGLRGGTARHLRAVLRRAECRNE